MPHKVKNSSVQASHPRPSIAIFDPLMAMSSVGITIGKLKMAMSVKLFPAFEAIIEFNVRAAEKAAEAKKQNVKNIINS